MPTSTPPAGAGRTPEAASPAGAGRSTSPAGAGRTPGAASPAGAGRSTSPAGAGRSTSVPAPLTAETLGIPGERERYAIRKRIIGRKLNTVLLPAMRRHGIDMWLVLSREFH